MFIENYSYNMLLYLLNLFLAVFNRINYYLKKTAKILSRQENLPLIFREYEQFLIVLEP